MPTPLVIYVGVDDTLVRTAGTKRIPMTEMIRTVRALHRGDAALYAWSRAGAEYARESARELGIEECFVAFLPKPAIVIDDQAPAVWRPFVHVHPAEAGSKTIEEYRKLVD